MLRFFSKALSHAKIAVLRRRVIAADDPASAHRAIQPLLRAQRHQKEAAACLVELVGDRHLPPEMGIEVLASVYEAHADDEELLPILGFSLEGANDVDLLNRPPPDHPLAQTLTDRLADLAVRQRGLASEIEILKGLSVAARMQGRQHDDLLDRTHRRIIELEPDEAAGFYNYGLFLKTRGRFAEGMKANQTAAAMVPEPVEPYEWNLGICATGAREADVALATWKRMHHTIEMGRFGLPEGGYPTCKVRLAERPLAERTADTDDPGCEETVWIERVSPCHGIIRSVLYDDLGVDFGDVVLVDGAPVTFHQYGDQRIPVFPHLATLERNGYQLYDFAGTQDEAGRLADASRGLDEDAVVYAHSENVVIMCAACWRDPDAHHDHQEAEHHVVTGRIAAPAGVDPGALLSQLDAAIEARAPCKLFAPDLCEAAGLADRARVEQSRFDMLLDN